MRVNPNLTKDLRAGDGKSQCSHSRQIKEKILQEIDHDRKKLFLTAVGHLLYQKLNKPVFYNQIVTTNGYYGGTTKYTLNFASFKTGSNARYIVTLIDILISLVLLLLIVIQHQGSFSSSKSDTLTLRVYPSVICGIQILYNLYCILDMKRIQRG